jgi:DAK2 domain fusion protein YloV
VQPGATPAPLQPLNVLTGADFRAALATSSAWLDRHVEAINALNVFPVPDGDTGLNMSLTLKSAVDQVSTDNPPSLEAIAASMAKGALLGARGNSGVILAQLLRGLARSLDSAAEVDASLLARALESGAEAAYSAVPNPVEGTILTVARAAAGGARAAADEHADLLATLERAHSAARAAVAETPEQLPILKQASVVDAGGEGYRVLLEGFIKHLKGEPVTNGPAPVDLRADLSSLHQDESDFFGYCTEVLFQGNGLDVEAVRHQVSALGTSVLVVGDREMLKVHVHTLRPGAVLDLATQAGEIVRVKVDNMQLQHREFAAALAAPTSREGPRQAGTSLVAVALGVGFQQLFASLGAVVVAGGQTMNPSVEEIAAALGRRDREGVIVLPNNRNVVLAAEQAVRLAGGRSAAVVPTANLPQGVAAALALNPEADVDANLPVMARAVGSCRCVEIARAVRKGQFGSVEVRPGALLALLDDEPVASGGSPIDLVDVALSRLPQVAYDIATIYVGAEGSDEIARALAAALGARLGIPTEVIFGGQPHYDYIISIE